MVLFTTHFFLKKPKDPTHRDLQNFATNIATSGCGWSFDLPLQLGCFWKQTLRTGVGHSEADLFFLGGLKLKTQEIATLKMGWWFFPAGKNRRFRTKGLPIILEGF